jgi:predicted dehydrogenase
VNSTIKQLLVGVFVLALLHASVCVAHAEDDKLRVGIIGCDTSHVIAFTKLINDPRAAGPLDGVEVTVAYPGGSPDLPDSRNRLDGFVVQLRELGVAIVDSAGAVADQSDAILLESVDGRVHLQQFRAVARGKPVFVDKPAAGSLADVLAVFRHADTTKTPCFSSSALRYCDQVTQLADENALGEILGCETAGPLTIEPHHPDLFWYGVHGVESLYALMGTGCESVTRVDSNSASIVVGTWSDGRLGSFRGLKHGKPDYAFSVYGTKGIAQRKGFSGYEPLVRKICDFFKSGRPPVSRDETIEIFAFMEAADESKRAGGRPVAIREVIARAEQPGLHGKRP